MHYPIPKEEAREDTAAEDISFHVYETKVSLHKTARRGDGLSWYRSGAQ
jgi:hypothetical protein